MLGKVQMELSGQEKKLNYSEDEENNDNSLEELSFCMCSYFPVWRQDFVKMVEDR